MYLIWQFGASEKKAEQNHFHLIKDDNLLQIKQIKSDSYGNIKLDNNNIININIILIIL